MASVTPASPDLELIDLFVHGALGIQNKCMEPQSIQSVCRGERKKIGKVTELIGGAFWVIVSVDPELPYRIKLGNHGRHLSTCV